MGQFTVPIIVHPPEGGPETTVDALVDTGTPYSVVPQPVAESLGYQPLRAQGVILADGRSDEWSLVAMDLECAGRRGPHPVLIGPPGSPVLLGAISLQIWSLGIDPVNHRLIPVLARI